MLVAYNESNINLNYLNSYVKYNLSNNKLYLYNTVFDKSITLESSDSANLVAILKQLENGVDTDNLISLLGKISDKPEKLYEYLLYNYIIE